MRVDKRFILLLGFIFLFTVLSGAARKWLVNGSQYNTLLFIIQLICPMLVALMGSHYFRQKEGINRGVYKLQQSVNRILLIYALLLLVFVFNPKSLTIFHGILGYVLHFAFWFFIFRFIQFRHAVEIRGLIPMFLIFSIAEITLGIIQYNLPPNHPLNLYNDMRTTSGVIAMVGNNVRVTGSFSYLSGYTSFLMFYTFLLVYIIATRYMKFILIVPLVVLGMIGVFISGSRTSFVMFFVVLILGLLGLRQFKTMFRFLGVVAFGVVLFVTALLLTGSGQQIYDFLQLSGKNLQGRYEVNRQHEQDQRLFGPLENVFNFKGKYPVFGVGLGATYQGAVQKFGASYFVEEFGYYEEETERIILEGGYLLLLIKIILSVLLMRYMKTGLVFTVPLLFLTLFYIPVIYNIYNIIFLGMGLMLTELAARRLEEEKRIRPPLVPVIPEKPVEEPIPLPPVVPGETAGNTFQPGA